MKVVHNKQLCEAHGVCTAVDPDRFELDDNDELMVHDDTVSDADLAKVRDAVDSCPRQALSLVDE
jgi:ferredoxin